MRSVLLPIALSLLLPCSAAAQDASRVEIKTIRLSETVYVLQGRLGENTFGGNVVASIGPDGILLVDSEYLSLSTKIRKSLKTIVGSDPNVRFIINTHWHRDHTEGNKEFGKEATIIAHEQVRQMLSTSQTFFGRRIEPYPNNAIPTITFGTSLSLNFNGEEIRVMHLPNGHTGGDSIVLFTKSRVIHTGDIYTGPVFPFIDLDHGGNVAGIEKNVRAILDLVSSDTKVVPGHRSITDTAALKTYHKMLSESLATVKQGRVGGSSLKEIQDRGLSEEWKTWEWEALKTPQWLEYVYRSLRDNEYLLPYPAGSFKLLQGFAGPFGHQGHAQFAYDFQMPIGSIVTAARGGEVVKVVKNNSDGTRKPGEENVVVIKHGDGTFARYYHLTKDGALVSVGDRVIAGDKIGLSGNSGASAGPHLHFDVTRDCFEWGCQTIPLEFSNTKENPLKQGQMYAPLSRQ